MTRNLYLGADLSPALNATDIHERGRRRRTRSSSRCTGPSSPRCARRCWPRRSRRQKPDIVGLQEAAWWRTGPYDLSAVTGHPKATQTDPQGGDFLTDLLNQLNKGGKKGKKSSAPPRRRSTPLRYRIAVVKTEFDFELPVNQGSGGLGACPAQCHNERLTMRDAILVRKGVKVSNASSGTFNTLLRVKVGGVAATST